jgi:M6 family metalloprotease-like protein
MGEMDPINLDSLAYSQTENVIIICIEFSNRQASSTTSSIMDKVNDLEDYYTEVSYGLKKVSGTLAIASSNDPDSDGWYDVGPYFTDYTSDSKSLINATIIASDNDINFNNFPHIMLVVAGDDYAQSGDSNDIHSHFISFQPGLDTDDGLKKVYNSCVVAETDPFSVFCHEFGHSQGLPDLYDIDEGDGVDEIFVDEFALMAEGSWNGNPAGSKPAGLMGYCRLNLSILDISDTVANGMHKVVDLFSLSETNSSALIKIPIAPDYYYLLEYRKKVGVDIGLPDQGLLITLVNESKGTTWTGYVMSHENGPIILKDAQPSTSSLDDAPFDIGINERSYFNDNINNVHIVLLQKNNSGYQIDIDRTGMATDNTPPTTDLQATGFYSSNRIYMGSLFLDPYDYKSGVNKTYYRIDGGSWQEYDSSVSMPMTFGVATFSLEFYSTDLNGNIENIKQISIIMDSSIIILIIIAIVVVVVIVAIYGIYRAKRGSKNDKQSSSYYQSGSSLYSSGSYESQGSYDSITEVKYTKYCSYCQMEYPEDQNFCFNCGRELKRKNG